MTSAHRFACRAGSLCRALPLNRDWRLDIADDFDFPHHEPEDVIFLRLGRHDLDDWGAALGYDDRLACRLNLFHHGEAASLEGTCWYVLHCTLSCP